MKLLISLFLVLVVVPQPVVQASTPEQEAQDYEQQQYDRSIREQARKRSLKQEELRQKTESLKNQNAYREEQLKARQLASKINAEAKKVLTEVHFIAKLGFDGNITARVFYDNRFGNYKEGEHITPNLTLMSINRDNIVVLERSGRKRIKHRYGMTKESYLNELIEFEKSKEISSPRYK